MNYLKAMLALREFPDVRKTIMPGVDRLAIIAALEVGADPRLHLLDDFPVVHDLSEVNCRNDENAISVTMNNVTRPDLDKYATLIRGLKLAPAN